MNTKTNTLQKFIDVFGDAQIIKAAARAKSIKSPGSIVGVTNPLMRFLLNATYAKNDRLYVYKNAKVSPEDYSYFCLVSATLSDLKPEIIANGSYKNQIAEKILHTQSGPMLSTMNEILVAAYYKYLGNNVTLNSSEQKGAADIDLAGLPFATDAKTFPNNRLLFEAIVNDSAQQIADAINLVHDQGLLIFLFEPNKKKLQESLRNLAKAFGDQNSGEYSDDTIRAIVIDNDYLGADFHITVQPNNANVFFQASWNLAPAVEELKASIEKAVKQAKALSKQAIPWIMAPRDGNRNGIEVQVLRAAANFHEYVSQHEDIFVMPVYALDFDGERAWFAFDVYETGKNTLNINAKTFEDFIQNLLSRPEILIE